MLKSDWVALGSADEWLALTRRDVALDGRAFFLAPPAEATGLFTGIGLHTGF